MSSEVLNQAKELRLYCLLLTKLANRDLEHRLGKKGHKEGTLAFAVMRALIGRQKTISEIAEKMFLASATLVPVVDALEKKKLVKRTHDSKDRRRNPLTLTPKGHKLVKSVHAVEAKDSLVVKLKMLGQTERAHLTSSMKKLAEALAGKEKIGEIYKTLIKS
jgi:DNA-binding MarR family transcriptional regulator